MLIEKHKISKESDRGKYDVRHDKTSGINYITVLDSKTLSMLSSAVEVTPL